MSSTACDVIFKDLLDMVELSEYDADPREVAQLFFVLWSNEMFPVWLSDNKDKIDKFLSCLEEIVSDEFKPSKDCISMINTYVKVIENNNILSDLKPLRTNSSMSDLVKTFIKVMLHNTMWDLYDRSQLVEIHNEMFNCLEFKDGDIVSGLPMDPRVKKSKTTPLNKIKKRNMKRIITEEARSAYSTFARGKNAGPLKNPNCTLSDLQKLFIRIMKTQVINFGTTTRRLVRNHLASFLEEDKVRIRIVESCLDITNMWLKNKGIQDAIATIILRQVESHVLASIFVDDDSEMKKNQANLADDIEDIISKLV